MKVGGADCVNASRPVALTLSLSRRERGRAFVGRKVSRRLIYSLPEGEGTLGRGLNGTLHAARPPTISGASAVRARASTGSSAEATTRLARARNAAARTSFW